MSSIPGPVPLVQSQSPHELPIPNTRSPLSLTLDRPVWKSNATLAQVEKDESERGRTLEAAAATAVASPLAPVPAAASPPAAEF